jgi:hypothetical protein
MSSDFVLEVLVAVMFEKHGGKIKLTVRHIGIPSGAVKMGQSRAGTNPLTSSQKSWSSYLKGKSIVTDNLTTTFKLGSRYPKLDPVLKRLEVLVDMCNIKGRKSGPNGETY